MNGRRLVILFLIAILALMSLAAAKAYEVQAGDNAEFSYGRAGVSFTESRYSGMLYLNRRTADKLPLKPDFTFSQKLVDARLYDDLGQRVNVIKGPVYVFFPASQKDAKLLEDGDLSIYFWDSWKNVWRACPTTVSGGRLICRMKNFGLYGVGVK